MTRPQVYHYSSEKTPHLVCRTCKRQLMAIPDENAALAGFGIHVYMAVHPTEADHLPDPVPYDQVEDPVFVCDFCSQPGISWSYPATGFHMPPDGRKDFALQGWGSADDWAACEACHDLIEADDWDALAERTVKYGSPVPERLKDEVMARVRELHAMFQQHRMGPPTRED